MRYKLITLAPSGNGTDLILKVHQQPAWWEALLGREAKQVSFFGPRPYWVTMDGRQVSRRVQRALDRVWTHHQQEAEPPGAGAWRLVEPSVANNHHRLAARATHAHASPAL